MDLILIGRNGFKINESRKNNILSNKIKLKIWTRLDKNKGHFVLYVRESVEDKAQIYLFKKQ